MNYNNNYVTTPINNDYRQFIPQYVQNPTWPNQIYNNMAPRQDYQQQNVSQNSIIWVQGENAAKSYPVNPNTAVALWDSEQQTIYIKSVDANGRPSLKILDYIDRDNEIVQNTQNDNAPEYVTQEQMTTFSEQINSQMAELQKNLNDFKSKVGNMKKVNK